MTDHQVNFCGNLLILRYDQIDSSMFFILCSRMLLCFHFYISFLNYLRQFVIYASILAGLLYYSTYLDRLSPKGALALWNHLWAAFDVRCAKHGVKKEKNYYWVTKKCFNEEVWTVETTIFNRLEVNVLCLQNWACFQYLQTCLHKMRLSD